MQKKLHEKHDNVLWAKGEILNTAMFPEQKTQKKEPTMQKLCQELFTYSSRHILENDDCDNNSVQPYFPSLTNLVLKVVLCVTIQSAMGVVFPTTKSGFRTTCELGNPFEAKSFRFCSGCRLSSVHTTRELVVFSGANNDTLKGMGEPPHVR